MKRNHLKSSIAKEENHHVQLVIFIYAYLLI
jgi:hypothetical protein